MKVLNDIKRAYRYDPARYFNFSRFEEQAGDYLLIEGLPKWDLLEKYRGQKLVYINLEEPNGFLSEVLSCHEFEDDFHKVLTLCPYTADWLNNKFKRETRVPVYFPFDKQYIPEEAEKTIDVIYSGTINSKYLKRVIQVISKFNYAFVSYDQADYATHIQANYEEKLSLMAKSRISVVHNLFRPHPYHFRYAKKNYPDIFDCKAFSKCQNNFQTLLHRIYPDIYAINAMKSYEPIAPQLKSRVFEAAFCKSLILCRRDSWNVIERYFTPDEDFVYYEHGNLERTLKRILADYGSYIPIIENAYRKAVNNYTTDNFFNDYLKDL